MSEMDKLLKTIRFIITALFIMFVLFIASTIILPILFIE